MAKKQTNTQNNPTPVGTPAQIAVQQAINVNQNAAQAAALELEGSAIRFRQDGRIDGAATLRANDEISQTIRYLGSNNNVIDWVATLTARLALIRTF
jgi:hypothetical protein